MAAGAVAPGVVGGDAGFGIGTGGSGWLGRPDLRRPRRRHRARQSRHVPGAADAQGRARSDSPRLDAAALAPDDALGPTPAAGVRPSPPPKTTIASATASTPASPNWSARAGNVSPADRDGGLGALEDQRRGARDRTRGRKGHAGSGCGDEGRALEMARPQAELLLLLDREARRRIHRSAAMIARG